MGTPFPCMRLLSAHRVLKAKRSHTLVPTPTPSREAEFTAFMHAYQNMVFSTAARLTGNDAQAEDLAQECFLKAYENFDMLRQNPAAAGWMKTVITNLALNHLQRYRNRWRFFSDLKRADADDDESDSSLIDSLLGSTTSDEVLASADADERSELVERVLKNLPDHQRVPLVLYHFEDLPYQEIAERLQVSLPKVKTDIMRGRIALAKILAKDTALRASLES